mgnify:CR=1 FL=1
MLNAQYFADTYFKNPRFKLFVKHNIKPKNLKAGTSSVVIGKAGPVVMLQNWVSCDHCLDNGILQAEFW